MSTVQLHINIDDSLLREELAMQGEFTSLTPSIVPYFDKDGYLVVEFEAESV